MKCCYLILLLYIPIVPYQYLIMGLIKYFMSAGYQPILAALSMIHDFFSFYIIIFSKCERCNT